MTYCDLGRTKAGSSRKTNPISGRRQCDASKCEMSRLGRVPPSAGRVVIDRKAWYLSLLAQAAVWLRELRVSRHFSTFYGSSVQSMDTQLDALPTLLVLARGVSGCVNSAFLDISRHFTAHLFSPWIPNSARSLDGGPLAPLSGNPSGEVACWYESSHNPGVWSLADLLSDEHGTCSTPSWWHRILTTPSSAWEGR